jgi:hypothetical protein
VSPDSSGFSERFAAIENIQGSMDINIARASIRDNIKTSAKDNL